MTTLIKEQCLTSCDYCPTDPCNIGDKLGNTCDYSGESSKLYFLLLYGNIKMLNFEELY